MTVLRVWATLPAEVLSGPLTNGASGAPVRRYLKPVLRAVFGTDYPVRVLCGSEPEALQSVQADDVGARLAGRADDLERLSLFVRQVQARLRAEGLPHEDQVATAAVKFFFALGDHERATPEAAAESFVGGRVEQRVARERTDRPTVDRVRAAFADPGQVARWEEQVRQVWADGPDRSAAAEQEAFAGHVRNYLEHVGWDDGKPSVDADGQVSWEAAVGTDAPVPFIEALVAGAGPSRPPVHPVGTTPEEDAGGRRPPMDRSLYERVWAVARSASEHPWLQDLPTLEHLIDLEVRSLARPYQLALPEARAGVAAAVLTYRAVMPEASLLDGARRARVEAEQPAAARVVNRMIDSFLISLKKPSLQAAWDELLPRTQADLSAIDLVVLPGLWDALHNAQYRPGFLTSITVWARITGEVQSLINDARGRFHAESGLTSPGGLDEQVDRDVNDVDGADRRSEIERAARIEQTAREVAARRGDLDHGVVLREVVTLLNGREPAGLRTLRADWDAVAAWLGPRAGESFEGTLAHLSAFLPRPAVDRPGIG